MMRLNKNIWVRWICGIAVAGMSSVCSGGESDYAVSEILKVRSLVMFDCKIAGYQPAPGARFRVQVRDVEAIGQIPAEEAAEYLHERLKNAEHVVLKNVQFRNYFRVVADVSVDGRDLKQELVQQGFAHLTEAPPAAAEVSQKTQTKEPPRRYPPPVPQTRTIAPRIERQYVTLQSLLDTEVDFSSVNEETPLAEALQILSESVRPHLPLVILWNDLETNALVSKDMPIGVGGVGKLTVKRALELVLHSASQRASTKLLLSVQGNIITIGTQKGLLVKSTARSYPVDDIVSVPAQENTENRRNN